MTTTTTLQASIETLIAGRLKMARAGKFICAVDASKPNMLARIRSIMLTIPADGGIIAEWYVPEGYDDDALTASPLFLARSTRPTAVKVWPLSTPAAEVAAWVARCWRWE